MSDTIKKRNIKLISGLTADSASSLCKKLLETVGIIDVNWNASDRLKVEYELMAINLAEIEKKLGDAGGRKSGGLINRFVRGWIHYTEENEAQNMRSVPHSCCSIPESK